MLGILLGVFFLVFLEVQWVLGIWYLGVVAFDLLLDFFFRMFFLFHVFDPKRHHVFTEKST